MNTSPFVGWVLNRSQSFPISLKKSTYLNSDAELLIYPKFTSMLLFISITLKRYYQVTLFCIIRVTSRNTISVDVPSPPFHLGGEGGGGRVRLHMGWYGLSSATKFTFFKHITLSYM